VREAKAFVITAVVGCFLDYTIGGYLNWIGIGAIFAVATMGTFILWEIRHPRKDPEDP
jgi:hypothetical protein